MKLLSETEHELAGITLHTIDTDKYKTNTIVLKLKAPLEEATLTERALLPYVLQKRTKSYPTTIELRGYLDELYGATLNVDLMKKGEYHVITIRMDIANETFLEDKTPLLLKAIELLSEMVMSPVTENDGFSPSTLDNEKRNLKQRIQAVYDDKMRYSNLRLVQEMCKDEPYALHVNGRIEDIEKITPASLYQYYQKVLAEDEIDLYIVGKFDENSVVEYVSKNFVLKEREPKKVDKISPVISEVNKVIEKQDVKQGKLNIGFRTNITYSDPDYLALQVFNGIYGGFSHSKLFLNVREKESLAYYAASRVESHKGLLMVMSGIEFNNFDKAVTIINEQMEAMKNGEFTEDVISQTKAVINNQLLETIDTPSGMIDILYHNVVADKKRDLTEWLEGLKQVTKDEIIQVAEKIKLDTIYFLTGMEADN
ncbi:EF-P 5-aminopentanol modification-associated protein YfmF [Bacillus sp. PS06]|uniref:EF-P 5-aminopentanol modification-associated protein YfmF n=1 Tax=Bacillus sp. PS06 TaxID=2764176 RepID=UPI0017848E5F|nr:pitrilysin family protein [Bacillus sp. PS06]MBD8068236.1 insulinase family protein [Bacillus sp. PS06]